MRTKNSLFNMAANVSGQVLNLILAFVCRKIFIRTLSIDYLGVNGLFSNILQVLSLAELGIGSAMIYSLYQPVAEDDEERICGLLNLYRRMYRIVAAAITLAGLALIPFLKYLIKDNMNIDHLVIIYLMFLADSVFSYFFSYKQSVITANQKGYICALYSQGITVARYLIQILILYKTHNFILYLGIQISCSFLYNVIMAVKAEQMYPYLKKNRRSLPEAESRRKIYKNITAMAMHKIGTVVVYNTDNLIMSAFVGITSVGIYSNYQMIIQHLSRLLGQVFGAFTASVGNLTVSEEPEKVLKVYDTMNFLSFLLFGYCSVALMVLVNPFINMWVGKEYLFPLSIILLLVVNFYLTGMRQVTLTFKDAMGLFRYDRYKPLAEVVINLVVSLILVRKYEIKGIFIGTVASLMLTSFWVDPFVFFRFGLRMEYRKNLRRYYYKYFHNTAVMALTGGIVYWLCSLLPDGGFFRFLLKAVCMTFMYNLTVLAIYAKTDEFISLWVMVKRHVLARIQERFGKR